MDNNYFGNICYCRKCNGIVHTIKKGDSLYLLSRYYNVPIGEIMNANRHLNIYNLQIGEEICIPIRRSDMLNDNVNNGMNNNMPNNNISNNNNIPNNNISNNNMPNNNMPNINIPDAAVPNMRMSDNNMPDSEMRNTPPDMRNITGDMPGIQMPSENCCMNGTAFDEADYGRMEASSVSCSDEAFDKNIRMSELINQEDMTFEKFLSLIQN